MKLQLEELEKIFEGSQSLPIVLEQTRRELDKCRCQLTQVDEQLRIYKRAETLLQGQKHLTEKIARGDELEAILDESCRLVEKALPGSLAIVMLLDGKRLRRGAAPSLAEYIVEVDGFEIGPDVGTCSAAAARGVPVITQDITRDPNWAGLRDLAERHGLQAGWATPILSSANRVLGTFALYWPEPRRPTPHDLQIVSQMAQLVAFAIERKQAADALRESERLARGQAEALTLTLNALARETDPDRAMEHVLRTVTALFGAHSCSVWLRDQVTGLMAFEFALEEGIFKTKTEAKLAAVSPSLAVEAIPTWAEMFRTQRPVVLEDIRIRPDFPWRAHLLTLGVITMLAVPMVIAGNGEGLIGIRFTRRRTFSAGEQELAQVLANQAMLAIQLSRLSQHSRQTAIVEERNRMAREIHDTLAQGFTGVIAQLEAARGAISRGRTSNIAEHLERAGEMARESLREARRSVQALRPLALEDKPLTTALRELMQRMTKGMPMKAKLVLKGKRRKLPPMWEANLLRIGQEALTNAIRHAAASRFDALLVFSDQGIRLSFQDNGSGYDLERATDGLGMQGMRERAEEMGGKVAVETHGGEGTIISIVIPSNAVSHSEKS
jgi:signal transduction histidine kinase